MDKSYKQTMQIHSENALPMFRTASQQITLHNIDNTEINKQNDRKNCFY